MIDCVCKQPLDERRTEIPDHQRIVGGSGERCDMSGKSMAFLFANRLDAYEQAVRERTPPGKLVVLDLVQECSIPPGIMAEIQYVRSGAAAREAQVEAAEITSTATKRESLAALCDTKVREAEKEIASLIVAMQKADAAKLGNEAQRIEREIQKAKKTIATNTKNAENLRAESARLREEASQIASIGREIL